MKKVLKERGFVRDSDIGIEELVKIDTKTKDIKGLSRKEKIEEFNKISALDNVNNVHFDKEFIHLSDKIIYDIGEWKLKKKMEEVV
ncbi:MAG: hypothetical protein ACE5KE_14555 [Methanosarcinales archaeon]